MVRVAIGTKRVDIDWKEGGNPVKEPPKGLTPAGDSGWYHSPEVVDPRNCEWYPDSPWCGGNPIDPSLEIGVEINVDPCGFTFTESGSALIKTPQFTQTYRYPGACRREYEKPPPVVPPPPIPEDLMKPPPDTPIPQGFGGNEYVAVSFITNTISYRREWTPSVQKYRTVLENFGWSASGVEMPSTKLFNGSPYYNYGPLQPASSSCDFAYSSNFNPDAVYQQYNQVKPAQYSYPPVTYYIDSRQGLAIDYGEPNVYHSFRRAVHNPNSGGAELVEGRFKDIFQTSTIPNRYYVNRYEGTDDYGSRYENLTIEIAIKAIAYCVRKFDPSKNPPPLPEPRSCDCMQCCFAPPSSSQSNGDDSCCREVLERVKRIEKALGTYPGKVTIFDANEDALGAQSKVIEFATVAQGLTRTIERVETISKIIGIDLLPVTVPKNIVEPVNDNFLEEVWDFLTPDATEKINNLFEWHVWNLKQMSGLIGHFQRYVEVEDKEETITKPDGTQETKMKTKKIPLPDISTSLVESIKNQIVLHREVGMVLDVCMKILVSSCNTKQEVAKVYAEISEIVDFLDYPTTEKSLEIPIQISIPPVGASDEDQQDLHKFLQPGTTIIKYNDWDGTNSFKDFMIHLATLMGRR